MQLLLIVDGAAEILMENDSIEILRAHASQLYGADEVLVWGTEAKGKKALDYVVFEPPIHCDLANGNQLRIEC